MRTTCDFAIAAVIGGDHSGAGDVGGGGDFLISTGFSGDTSGADACFGTALIGASSRTGAAVLVVVLPFFTERIRNAGHSRLFLTGAAVSDSHTGNDAGDGIVGKLLVSFSTSSIFPSALSMLLMWFLTKVSVSLVEDAFSDTGADAEAMSLGDACHEPGIFSGHSPEGARPHADCITGEAFQDSGHNDALLLLGLLSKPSS